MLKKLKAYFPSAVETTVPPKLTNHELYWFQDTEAEDPYWLGIPKNELQKGQLELLEAMYQQVTQEPLISYTGAAMAWHAYLFLEGDLPAFAADTSIRFIQLQIRQLDQEGKEIEAAIQEFFHNSRAFIWLTSGNAVIIEELTEVGYEDNDFLSIANTLENEFFIRPFFYIGRFRSESERLRVAFFQEQELFLQAMNYLHEERVFSFERIFPTLLAARIPSLEQNILINDIVPILTDDPELRRTLMIFLENNSNTSLAAKKLYVHRNTLQYRIDKFTEKTRINLKEFPSAITAYLACLISLMD